jgi:hypothetical protein
MNKARLTYGRLLNNGLTLGLLTFVTCYTLITVQHVSQHFFGHQHHNACSEELELDLCHRRIHHHEQINSCSHDSHVEQLTEHCDSCDALVAKTFKDIPRATDIPTNEAVILSNLSITDLAGFIIPVSPITRGPPRNLCFMI